MDIQGNQVIASEENVFTEEIFIEKGKQGTVTITGTFDATLTLQCRLVNTTDWIDVDTVTEGPRYYFEGGNDYWRFGCKTGDFTSGDAEIRIQG